MKHKITKYLIVFLCVIGVLCGSLQADLDNEIAALIKKHGLRNSAIGLKIISLKNGQTVYEKNADTLLVPASNLKLITTGVALARLGADFKYETILYRQGEIRDNTLYGNLVVTSNGDPNISGRLYEGNTTSVFEEWADLLKKSGIKEVVGQVIIDDTAFDRDYIPDTWPRDQLGLWYCAPVSAVSFNDNCVDITAFYDKEEGKVGYRLDPPTSYVEVINKCKVSSEKSRHSVGFYRDPEGRTITISGSFYKKAAPYKESIPIDNPGLYFGTVFKETLGRQGVKISGSARLATKSYTGQTNLRELGRIQTDLLTSLTIANKNSQNFYAEQILKTIGYQATGKGTFKNGCSEVQKFLKEHNILPAGQEFRQLDGSGLSKGNRLTADIIINLLAYLAKHKDGEKFRTTLPLNGVDGTLKKRLNGNGESARIWAKTGYINGVSALSGYLKSNHSKDYAFSIIINHISDVSRARRFQDDVLRLVLDE